MEGDSIKLYEPPQSVHSFSGAEVLSFWDGSRVVVERLDTTNSLQTLALQPWLIASPRASVPLRPRLRVFRESSTRAERYWDRSM
jgi:hypothetical protein